MWHKYEDDPAADGDIPDGKEVDARRKEMKKLETTGEEEENDLMKKKYAASRAFKISKEDAEKHG